MNRIGIGILLIVTAVHADALEDAIEGLKSDNWRTVITAARAVESLTSKPKKVAPLYVHNLRWNDEVVRKAMRRVLIRWRADAAPALVKGLKKNKDKFHRREIAKTLLEIGAYSEDESSNMIKLLNDPDVITRHLLAETLAKHGKDVEPLLQRALGSRSSDMQEGAAWALGARGVTSVPLLRAALHHKKARVRAGALLAVSYLKAGFRAFTADVRPLLASPDVSVRRAAASALGRIGTGSAEAVAGLIGVLGDTDFYVREAAVQGLTKLAPTSINPSIEALGGKNAAAARRVLVAIGRSAFSDLQLGTASKNPLVRENCVLVFGEALPFDTVPLSGMISLLDDKVAAVRRATVVTIGVRDPSDWFEKLISSATDADATVREAVMRALGRAKSNPQILAALGTGTADKDPAVHLAAAAALWNFGEPSDVLKLALQHLAGSDQKLRTAACIALRPMGRAAKSAIPALIAMGPDRAAVDALGAITASHGGGLIGRAKRFAKAPKKTQESIDAALSWLASVQDRKASGKNKSDGRWDSDNFIAHDKGGDPGQPLYDAGVTGLALSAFLAVGRADNDAVREGLAYLVRKQNSAGVFSNTRSQHFQLAHAFALAAVCEAWILTGNPNHRRAAQLGVDFCVASRTPGGGWRYDPRGSENDTDVTVVMMHVLALAERGGLEVDPGAFFGGGAWIHSMTDGLVGYNERGGLSARPPGLQDLFPPDGTGSMSAAGLWGMALTENHGVTSPDFDFAIKWCRKLPPVWAGGRVDMYYWYWGSLYFHARGGKDGGRWKSSLKKALVGHQSKSGPAKGSWAPDGPWGKDGGRIYSTAICSLALATPYRMVPQYWKVKPSGPYAAGAKALATLAKSKDPVIAKRAALWLTRAGG